MVNIGDVARAAGVSRSTASYALSGKRTTTPAVQARAAVAVRELGYTTNAGARALATSQTKVIGLLAQFCEDEFAPAMLQYILGVSNTARELGYDVLLVTEESGAHALRRITDSRMVDGIVLLNVRARRATADPAGGHAARCARGAPGRLHRHRRLRPRLRGGRAPHDRSPGPSRASRAARRLSAGARGELAKIKDRIKGAVA